jgi:nucleoside-diphosphate-sugar epimerase
MKSKIYHQKIILPGGAGLVGQNLVALLGLQGFDNIVVLDKHQENLSILKKMHPFVKAYYADLAEIGPWRKHFLKASTVVMLQAQIGGNDYKDFVRNNVDASELIIKTIKKYNVPQLVHISSSVVESVANDFYTRSKKIQEAIVIKSKIKCPILRPTLMFGWFDRKHLGWLSRFMKKVPFFPIPGNGKFMRQPLYVGDFCNIIISCIKNKEIHGVFNITGLERIDYIDIIREIKISSHAKTFVIKIPYKFFYGLLWFWNLFDKNPPFTVQQLEALSAKDEFEVIDWPEIFKVTYTPFKKAIYETFNHPKFSKVVLKF